MNTSQIMRWVILALLPGTAAYAWVYGGGVLWNAAILVAACSAVEAICIALRDEQQALGVIDTLADGSAVLTALLIAICLPPFVDLHVLLVAALASIGLAKHAYGGLGQNTFNPAMVGYAVILVSYPEALTVWPQLSAEPDTLTGATLLTQFRYREALTTAEFAAQYAADSGQTGLVALAYLLGGLFLIYKRIIAWRIPITLLMAVGVCAILANDQGSSQSHGSLLFHWTAGGLVAAAFFVATDPITHPTRASHQFLFAAIVGVLLFWIRAWGSFPDGIAFAVLLGNCVTPLLNRLHRHYLSERHPQIEKLGA